MIGNIFQALLDCLFITTISPEDPREPIARLVLCSSVSYTVRWWTCRSLYFCANFRQICVFPAPPIPWSRKTLLSSSGGLSAEKNSSKRFKHVLRPVNFGLGRGGALTIGGGKSSLELRTSSRSASGSPRRATAVSVSTASLDSIYVKSTSGNAHCFARKFSAQALTATT